MFDTYLQRHTTEHVTKNINVTERRAPTDESVKLLNEMTNKALSNLVSQFSTTNNTLQTTCVVYQDYPRQQKMFICKYTLNGKDNILEVEIPDYRYDTPEKRLEELYKQICNRLAVEFMQPFYQALKESSGGKL